MTPLGAVHGEEDGRIPGAGVAAVLLIGALVFVAGLRVARPITLAAETRSVHATGGPAGEPLPRVRVQINTATAAELTLLPGIGPRLGDRIVAEREANGRFDSVDELARVGGIGPGIVARVSPHSAVEVREER